MSANINSFASLRVPAWHGLGKVLDHEVSPLEFMTEAGLDWTTSLNPVFASTPYIRPVPNVRSVVRSDNEMPIGIVGNDYTSVQNVEMFQFLKDLGEFDLELKVETAGALGAGEIVWALASVPSLRIALGNDFVDFYLLLTNGHIGNRRFTVMPSTVRVVCQNTLAAAMRSRIGTGLAHGWDLKHTANIQDSISQVKSVLKEIAMSHAESLGTFSRLADIPADWEDVQEITEKVWGKAPEGKNAKTIAEKRMDAIAKIWNSPTSRNVETRGTLWTAFNAVTEWIDHESTVRAANYTAKESRFIGTMLGGSASRFKETAFSYVIAKAGINA